LLATAFCGGGIPIQLNIAAIAQTIRFMFSFSSLSTAGELSKRKHQTLQPDRGMALAISFAAA